MLRRMCGFRRLAAAVVMITVVFVATQITIFEYARGRRKLNPLCHNCTSTAQVIATPRVRVTKVPVSERAISKDKTRHWKLTRETATLSTTVGISKKVLRHPYAVDTAIDKDAALLAGLARKKKGLLTIGIPSIHREGATYMFRCVNDLLAKMEPHLRSQITIVIFLADFSEEKKKAKLGEIVNQYHSQLESGLIRVIGAPREFYPPLDKLKRTYHHPMKRVVWRSKQNCDYAFLMRYCVNISRYYLQMEDDVLTVNNYTRIITDFIDKQEAHWVCLEFSKVGYIGKLYRSTDLEKLAGMLLLFYEEQPPDVTFLYFTTILLQPKRIVRIPTIFRHIGMRSSLSGKIERTQGRYFHDSAMLQGDNPPATVYTNFTSKGYDKRYLYNPTDPSSAYAQTDAWFWATRPQPYSYLLVVFHQPYSINHVYVKTGQYDNDTDMLDHGILEVSPELVHKNKSSAHCDKYVTIGHFTSGVADVRNVTDLVPFRVVCLRVTMTQRQKNWIIFSDIQVFVDENTNA